MTDDLPALRAKFAEIFEQWEVERGEYVEFYAFHRIWGDHHARIYADGEEVSLETLETTFISPPDDPEATERSRRQMEERNQRLLAELEDAGLLGGGPVPNSFTINAFLVTGAGDHEANRPRKIVLRQTHDAKGSRHLEVARAENGDIVFTGQDLGDGVEEIFGASLREYEWELRIRAEHVEAACAALGGEPGADILDLIERRTLTDVEARREFEAAGITVEFWSRVGD
ncbi:MAG: hypothetical protein WD770_04640 [Actinomycetota bacterium]